MYPACTAQVSYPNCKFVRRLGKLYTLKATATDQEYYKKWDKNTIKGLAQVCSTQHHNLLSTF